ncbi:MAG: 50S ribosomal protein L25 [Candidatus Latescibacter sp.]|nr:50S ribosomal protein L25 [Candidatus Latescibacter sp.]
MAEASLKAQVRTVKGKQASKHLRKEGHIPGVLYGPGENPSLLSLDSKEFLTLLHSFGRNVVVDLAVGDKKKKVKAFIYEIQHDPISGDIIHVDLKHISLKVKIHVTVPVHLGGIPVGVKNEGGILEHIMHTVEISCLPTDIPESISLDVTSLHTGDGIHIKDLPHEKFEILAELESVVVHVVAPRVVAVEEPTEVGIAEPEVIGEKKEEE